MVNKDFIREALRQYWRFNGQKEGFINLIADECEKQSAFDYASVKNVVKSMVDAGRLPEAGGYREVFDFFWSKHSDFAGVQGNENILVQDLQSRGARFTVQGLEEAFERLIQQKPNPFQHNQRWHDQQAQAVEERYERKQLTAQGRQAAALEAELLQDYRAQLQARRSKQETRTSWTDKADAAMEALIQKESDRLGTLSFDKLQAEKSARDAEKTRKKALNVFVLGTYPAPSQYKTLPQDYHGEPWTMKLLNRLGGIGRGEENKLRLVIRAYGADAINHAVRANAQKGVV